MEFIFFAALCSVCVSIFLKISKTRNLDPMQMIAWNYAIASILCFVWFKPDLAHISLQHTPWWLIVILGICLPSVFLLLSKSLDHAGILKTEIAQRLSLVLSLIGAYFLFGEQFNTLKLLGIGLGLLAIAMIVLAKSLNSKNPNSTLAVPYLLAVWGGYALIDLLLKYQTSLGVQFAVSLNLMFVCALILSLIYLAFMRVNWHIQNVLAGFLLGGLNFLNIALYVQAHMQLKDSPAVVFAGMNILVVVFGVFAGIIIFKEKINTWVFLGVVMAILAVMSLSMSL